MSTTTAMPDDLETDDYRNPVDGSDLIYCCFPDCGCDGSRLCMAKNGASDRAFRQNAEGMWTQPAPLGSARRKARDAFIVSVSLEGKDG